MCYTQSMSVLLAMGAFGVAAYEYYSFRCPQYSMGIAYYGLMELLQAIQHFYVAVPEDNYSMCHSPMNQFLTSLAVLHICFNPSLSIICTWVCPGNTIYEIALKVP